MKTSLRYYIKPSRIMAPPIGPLAVDRVKDDAGAVAIDGRGLLEFHFPVILDQPTVHSTLKRVRRRRHGVQKGGFVKIKADSRSRIAAMCNSSMMPHHHPDNTCETA